MSLGFLIPRPAPATEARALEPLSCPSNAELIEAFCCGGMTVVVAVYLLGTTNTKIPAGKAAPRVTDTTNLRRRERTINPSSKCSSPGGGSEASDSLICSWIASSFMQTRFLKLSYQPLARIPTRFETVWGSSFRRRFNNRARQYQEAIGTSKAAG